MRCTAAAIRLASLALACLLAALMRPSVGFAQRGMPKITPGIEVAIMKALIGTWSVTELWEAWEGMSPGGEGTGVQTVVAGPGDMSIVFTYQSTSGPFPGYRAAGMMSWEPDQLPNPFRAAWSQSVTPGISIETGHLEGRDLVMSYEIVERGTPYTVKNVYSSLTRSSYTVTSYFVDKQGGVRKALTLKYIRK